MFGFRTRSLRLVVPFLLTLAACGGGDEATVKPITETGSATHAGSATGAGTGSATHGGTVAGEIGRAHV